MELFVAVIPVRKRRRVFRSAADLLNGMARPVTWMKMIAFLRKMARRFRPSSTATTASQPWVPGGHFYSPIVDPKDEIVQRTLRGFEGAQLADGEDLTIDPLAMLELLQRLGPLCAEIPFRGEKQDHLRYYFANSAFSYCDAAVYFGMLRHFRPTRVIEIGCGYSSCLLMDTNDRFLNRSIHCTFIDPYPEALLRLLAEDDPYRGSVVSERGQNIGISCFKELGRNDILFIDSSHVSKMGSDVNDYMFRILPQLQSGVIVHVHDIPYPFEYQPAWIADENRSWNEAYLLHAFLQYNRDFKIIFFNHYLMRMHAGSVSKYIPICLQHGGASIWLQKQ